jgi:uncharacterized protein YecE (DUF72 family)
MKTQPDIKIGCCGFPVGKQEYYAHFGVIEVNVTFYQPPKISTLTRWRQEAPKDFEFVLKAWQLITHHCGCPTYRRLRTRIPEAKRRFYGNFKPTDEVFEAWDATLECARTLEAKLVLFQTPPVFGPTAENVSNMRRFFKKAKRKDLVFVWEPRGKWLESGEDIKEICQDLGLIHCAIDPFRYKPLFGGLNYFRLHGRIESGHIDYDYQYGHGELRRLFDMCGGKESYCMFNNSAMYEDALRFLNVAAK